MGEAETERIDCRLCGGRRSRRVGVKFGLAIVKCRRCGLLYVNPRLVEREVLKRYTPAYFFDEYLPSFAASRTGFDPAVVGAHYTPFVELARVFSGPGRRLLDIGSGAGFFLQAVEGMGWRAEGVELSAAAAAYARDVVGVPMRTGKVEAAGLPSGTYDLVTMLDFLEHVFEPLDVLREAYRLLKPGGALIVYTPDIQSLGRRFLGKSWAVLTPAEHLTYFSAKTLRRALETAGFEVRGVRTLWGLNPGATHDKGSRRYRVFEKRYRRFERGRVHAKLHRLNFLDLYAAAKGERFVPPGTSLRARLAGRLYAWSRPWLHGDGLVAIGVKPAARPSA